MCYARQNALKRKTSVCLALMSSGSADQLMLESHLHLPEQRRGEQRRGGGTGPREQGDLDSKLSA